MAIVIKNGRVIDPASQTDRIADVLIVDGKIAGVAPDLSAPGAEVFDAGTIDFGGEANKPVVARMLANLWTHMSGITVPCPPTQTRHGVAPNA